MSPLGGEGAAEKGGQGSEGVEGKDRKQLRTALTIFFYHLMGRHDSMYSFLLFFFSWLKSSRLSRAVETRSIFSSYENACHKRGAAERGDNVRSVRLTVKRCQYVDGERLAENRCRNETKFPSLYFHKVGTTACMHCNDTPAE